MIQVRINCELNPSPLVPPGDSPEHPGGTCSGQQHADGTAVHELGMSQPNVTGLSSVHAGRSAEEVLSAEQLCQRRLDNVRQLKELYETELLNALEEQRSRHSHSRKQASAMGEAFLLLVCSWQAAGRALGVHHWHLAQCLP